MSVLASFLLITKFNLTLGVYYEMQTNLMKMTRSIRQIVMLACSLTMQQKSQKAAAAYRSDVAYRALVLFSATSTMLTKANDLNSWEAPGVSISELGSLKLLDDSDAINSSYNQQRLTQHPKDVHPRQYEAGYSLPSDLNLRVPTILAHQLIHAIAAPSDSINLDSIQMSRIFLILYVFTMPFAILSADLKLLDGQVILLVFIMTYGFMGLELVSTSLDDPFGSDPSDLPVISMMNELNEDIFLMISRTDGLDAALRLRDKMKPARCRSVDSPTEKDNLLCSTFDSIGR
eukprot:scaffold19525_cov68-Cyclotella_meneghiniana.AAC.7